MIARWLVMIVFAVAVGGLLPGCGGGGIETKVPDIGDAPPGEPPPGGGDDEDDPPAGEPRFRGTYITSYGDDFIAAAASSPSEYAGRIVLDQEGTEVTGTGAMARYFRTGPFNNAQFEFTVGGSSAPGSNDGLITFRNRQNRNDFDRLPVWAMRRVGSRLLGIYGEFNTNDQLVRSGHAVWTREETGSVEGTWIAVGTDSFAVEGSSRFDRTSRIALSNSQGNTVEGSGGFVEQTFNDGVLTTNVTVTEGARQDQRIGLRLGGAELGETEFQHIGFFSDSFMHTTYGQYLNRQELLRMGHVTWVRGQTPDAAAINGTWVAAFSDSRTRGAASARSFVTVLRLELQEGNVIGGSGHVLDEGDPVEVNFRSAEIQGGSLVGGTRLQLSAVKADASFEWDLRVGANRMVGTYRRLNSQGEPVGVGSAEFFRGGAPAPQGTWTAAFVDRINEVRAPESQLAIVQIADPSEEGLLTGTGRLQYAAEIDDLERVFNLTGEVRQDHPSGPWIQWTWSGSDIAGDTVWNLRQQNNIMVGSYTNFTANGNLESRGHAVWYR